MYYSPAIKPYKIRIRNYNPRVAKYNPHVASYNPGVKREELYIHESSPATMPSQQEPLSKEVKAVSTYLGTRQFELGAFTLVSARKKRTRKQSPVKGTGIMNRLFTPARKIADKTKTAFDGLMGRVFNRHPSKES